MTTKTKAKTDEELADYFDTHTTADEDVVEVEVEAVADPTTVRSVRLRRSTLTRLNAAAEARGVGPTELMRSWIEERLDAEESPERTPDQAAMLAVMRTVVELGIGSGIPMDVVQHEVLDVQATSLKLVLREPSLRMGFKRAKPAKKAAPVKRADEARSQTRRTPS